MSNPRPRQPRSGSADRKARGRGGVRLDDGRLPRLVDAGRRVREPRHGARALMAITRALSPIALEVIEGSIRSAELEIEAAVERTARSPMIRDHHDYRVALFDAQGRKLTGRSY